MICAESCAALFDALRSMRPIRSSLGAPLGTASGSTGGAALVNALDARRTMRPTKDSAGAGAAASSLVGAAGRESREFTIENDDRRALETNDEPRPSASLVSTSSVPGALNAGVRLGMARYRKMRRAQKSQT
jgi:hypothetical protein